MTSLFSRHFLLKDHFVDALDLHGDCFDLGAIFICNSVIVLDIDFVVISSNLDSWREFNQMRLDPCCQCETFNHFAGFGGRLKIWSLNRV